MIKRQESAQEANQTTVDLFQVRGMVFRGLTSLQREITFCHLVSRSQVIFLGQKPWKGNEVCSAWSMS